MMKENLWEGIGTASGVSDVDDRLFVKESWSVALYKKALVDGGTNQWYILAGTQ